MPIAANTQRHGTLRRHSACQQDVSDHMKLFVYVILTLPSWSSAFWGIQLALFFKFMGTEISGCDDGSFMVRIAIITVGQRMAMNISTTVIADSSFSAMYAVVRYLASLDLDSNRRRGPGYHIAVASGARRWEHAARDLLTMSDIIFVDRHLRWRFRIKAASLVNFLFSLIDIGIEFQYVVDAFVEETL